MAVKPNSNYRIKRIFRNETNKEENRRKYNKEQTEICIQVAADLFNTEGRHVRRKLQKQTSTKLNTAVEILKSGITPLGILYEMMTGDRDFDPEVIEICKLIAPYVHPKLTAVALQMGPDNMTHEEALKELDRFPNGRKVLNAVAAASANEEEDEDGSITEADYEEIPVDNDTVIGIVHPRREPEQS